MNTKGLSAEHLLNQVDGVLFDMDGVLLDTESLYTEATRIVLGERAVDFTWEIKRTMMGRTGREAAELLVQALALPFSADEYMVMNRPVLLSLFPSCQPRPGARELVEYCAKRGLRMAVATSSHRSYFEIKTKHHPWFSLFDAIVCGSDDEVKAPKPAPDIFLVAAQKLGLKASRCVIFEDSLAGVEAAKKAAAHTIVALPDQRMNHSEMAAADYILQGFEEIELPSS